MLEVTLLCLWLCSPEARIDMPEKSNGLCFFLLPLCLLCSRVVVTSRYQPLIDVSGKPQSELVAETCGACL